MASGFFKRAKALLGRETPEPAVAAPRPAPKKFHAVMVEPGPRSCPHAKALVGQRFLSSEAPPLPLKNCDMSQCECRYAHYDDRRKGTRRARDMAVAIDGFEGVERRTKESRGRRKTDK